MVAPFSQARLAELQQWFYKAERSGILSHTLADFGMQGGIAPPTPQELVAFKKVVTALTDAKPGPDGLDKGTFSGAFKLQAMLRGYQATRSPPIPPDGQMNAATWAALAKDQNASAPDLDAKTKQSIAAADTAIAAIQQKTIKDLTTSHALWMQAREAAGLPVKGLARDPLLSLSSAAIESKLCHPAFSDNGRYFGCLQLNDEKKSWFADPAMKKTVIGRLTQMAKLAGPNADPALKGEWNEARLHAQYKTNNYIQSVAYNEHMSKDTRIPEGQTIYDKMAKSYISKHLLPAAMPIINANPGSNQSLYALALEQGKGPKEWAQYMADNTGVFMHETLDSKHPPANDWMKKSFGEYTARQVSSAMSAGTLPVDAAKFITDNPRQVVANASHFLQTKYEEIKNPKQNPAAATNTTVASIAPANTNAATGATTTAPAEKPLWRRALNSVGMLGQW